MGDSNDVRERGKVFWSKIANVFANKDLVHLDRGEIEWKVLDIFQGFLKKSSERCLYVGTAQERVLFEDEVVQTLEREGILFYSKYFSFIYLKDPCYYYEIETFVKQFRARIPIFKRPVFWLWRKVHGVHFLQKKKYQVF